MEGLIFVDTSALFAVIDHDDHQHDSAFAEWRNLVQAGEHLVTSNYIVVELFSLVQSRLGFPAAREIESDMLPLLDVVWIDQETHDVALRTVLVTGRRNLSLVDCSSFEVMRRKGLRTAFALDKHFKEQGFDAVP